MLRRQDHSRMCNVHAARDPDSKVCDTAHGLPHPQKNLPANTLPTHVLCLCSVSSLACFPKQGASRLGNFFSLPWLGESKPAHQGMRFHLVDVKQYHLIIVHCRVRHHFCHLIVCVHLR